MPPSLSARFGSAFQNPNPDIRPERSHGWDTGIDQEIARGRGTISLTYFHNSLRDLIGFESAPFPALGRNVNIDRARTSGLEVSGRVSAGILDARIAYTLLSARSLSAIDPAEERLIRRPRHALSADIGLTPTGRSVAGLGLIVVANREDTDFNSFPQARVRPGDYAVARLYGSFDLTARFTLRARIENLFDTRYEPVYGFPALGRTLRGSVEMWF
jgi:vitamin B12 transporter